MDSVRNSKGEIDFSYFDHQLHKNIRELIEAEREVAYEKAINDFINKAEEQSFDDGVWNSITLGELDIIAIELITKEDF